MSADLKPAELAACLINTLDRLLTYADDAKHNGATGMTLLHVWPHDLRDAVDLRNRLRQGNA